MANESTVVLGLDITAFRKKLSSAVKAVKDFGKQSPEVTIGVDDTAVDGAQAKISGLNSTATVALQMDTSQADEAASSFTDRIGILGAFVAGALSDKLIEAGSKVAENLQHGAVAAGEFNDALEVAFKKQGIVDVGAEIERVSEFTLNLANNLGLPVERTKELATSVATLGGFTGQSADDLTKLAAGLEVFTKGAVTGEQVVKAFSAGIADPEAASVIDALAKKYPQLGETLASSLSPTEKLAAANEALKGSFEDVAAQQQGFTGVLNSITNQFTEVYDVIGNQLAATLTPLAGQIKPIFDQIMPIIEEALALLIPIGKDIANVVADLVKQLGPPVIKLLQSAVIPLIGMIGKLVPVILLVVKAAMGPLVSIINILVDTIVLLIPVLQPIIDLFIELLPVIADLVGQLLQGLVPVIKSVAGLFIELVKNITQNKVAMALLRAVLNIVVYALDKVIKALVWLFEAATTVVNIISKVTSYIRNLINAIASFDLAKIRDALLGLSDANEQTAQSSVKVAEATDKAAEAQDGYNKEIDKGKGNAGAHNDDAEAAKKLAEELARAREQLAALNDEQAKGRELAAADLLATEEERQKKRVQIELKYQVKALEQERAQIDEKNAAREKDLNDRIAQLEKEKSAITETGDKRVKLEQAINAKIAKANAERVALAKNKSELVLAQEAVVNKKIEIATEDAANKIKAIEGQAAFDRVKNAIDAEKKIDDATTKLIQDRVDKLKTILDAGGIAVVDELVGTQRTLIDRQLNSTLNAIVESTPQFKAESEKIGRELSTGLIDEKTAKDRLAILRQTITSSLLSSTDAADISAQQVKQAYDKAATDIANGTKQVSDAIQKNVVEKGFDIFIEGLSGVGEAILKTNFAAPYIKAREALKGLNEEQSKLIESVKAGSVSYQDATTKFAELEKQRREANSATAAVIAEAFRATAQQQLNSANEQLAIADNLRKRNQEIADEIVRIDEEKTARLEQLAKQRFENEQLYEAAKTKITDDAALKKSLLNKEETKNTEKAAEAQSAALNSLGTAAGAAFAGLATGAVSASDALKAVVGDTVKALLKIYTPTIVGAFASIIPGPFGIAAGFAAVATLQALLSSALAGFKEGGFTGNAGTSTVAGFVHGQEFVVNAKGTAANRDLLEHINRGGSVDSFAGTPISEMQMMRAELQAIRQRLDSMPNGINGRQAVSLDVGFDTYLFERDRRKVAVRGIRG